jgi:N-acetyl sugar amidotransferase
MDTTDPGISFDPNGICNRCRDFEIVHAYYVRPSGTREMDLQNLVSQIKAEGRNKEYDCVIGVSGGVDSTYVAYLVKKNGLRPLAVHLDNGWDSALAVSNIENCVKALSIDLYTCVLDWDEFRDLQLSFLKASTPDSEIPTDHAILAILMWKAAEIGVRYIISGANIATEGLYAPEWSMGHYDWKYIRTVHERFGRTPLNTFPHFDLLDLLWLRFVKRQRQVYILNYIDYRKDMAAEFIRKELGWNPYTGKHHESIYTRFFQSYILPRKFSFDKRRMHLSTLIMSGQLSRTRALEEIEKPIGSQEMLREDKTFVSKKLGITERELDEILALPAKKFKEYPSYERSLPIRAYRAWQRISRKRRTSRIG